MITDRELMKRLVGLSCLAIIAWAFIVFGVHAQALPGGQSQERDLEKMILVGPGKAAPARSSLRRPRPTPVKPPGLVNPIDALLAQIIGKLQTAIPDLQAADALAVGPNAQAPVDPIAHACYPAEIQFLQSLSVPPANAAGIATAFEQARLLRMQLQNGLPSYLVIGCAPLFQDEATTLVKMAGLVGITISAAQLQLLINGGLILGTRQ